MTPVPADHHPGSPALEAGCTCDSPVNLGGRGFVEVVEVTIGERRVRREQRYWQVKRSCPVHGGELPRKK